MLDDHFEFLLGRYGRPNKAEPCAEKELSALQGRLPATLGECYGFFPALEIGGVSLVENTRKVKALEHFTFLAQLGPVRLFDYSSGRQQFVRELGAG